MYISVWIYFSDRRHILCRYTSVSQVKNSRNKSQFHREEQQQKKKEEEENKSMLHITNKKNIFDQINKRFSCIHVKGITKKGKQTIDEMIGKRSLLRSLVN